GRASWCAFPSLASPPWRRDGSVPATQGSFRMETLRWRSAVAIGATALTLVCAMPALADDTEIYVSQPGTGVKPNVLFILDTSGSMSSTVPGSGGMTRLEIVRDVAINLATSLKGVNLGLMRYSTDAQGGYVLNAVKDMDVDANRASILDTLNSF